MTASAERNQLINRSPEKTTHPSVIHGTKAQDTASRAGLGKVTAVPHCSQEPCRFPCFSSLFFRSRAVERSHGCREGRQRAAAETLTARHCSAPSTGHQCCSVCCTRKSTPRISAALRLAVGSPPGWLGDRLLKPPAPPPHESGRSEIVGPFNT